MTILNNSDLKLVNFKNAKNLTTFSAGLDFASKKALETYKTVAETIGVLFVKDSEAKNGDRITARFSGTPKTVRLSIRVAKGKAGVPAFKGKVAKYYASDLDENGVKKAEKDLKVETTKKEAEEAKKAEKKAETPKKETKKVVSKK